MRVLVTGANGQLGRELTSLYAERGDEVIGVDVEDFDITDEAAATTALTDAKPDVVIHGAAFTAVDRCESEPDVARAVNEVGSRNIARAARSVGARLVAVSTDYVFDGTKPEPYVESDEPNPVSVYGITKLAGERAVRAEHPDAAIARTAWVCGAHGNNMVRTVLRLAENPDQPLAFVDDQVGCPTIASDLAIGLARIADTSLHGVVHCTNQGPVSWFGFVQEILRVAGHDPDRVRPISTADLTPPRPAPRPANSVLDNAVMRAAGIALLPPWQTSLPSLVAAIATQ